jgi:TatD DNase family protein
LAAEVGKPVVIHNREASDDLLQILADWHANLVESEASIRDRPGVLHSFSGNADHAAEAMAHNFFLGITGPVTFKKALDLQRLVADLPLASLLIETDAPFLSPHPRRGRRNEPANVQWVAQKVAELKGVDVGVVRQQTFENAARLFGW